MEDSLLHANGLTHHGEHVPEDEELTPTLENFFVLTWLRLIHPSLPRLVKQRYGTELRSRTLPSIKPEISQALSSLLEEIRASDDAKILRAAVADDFRRPRPGGRSDPKTRTRQPRQDKVCPLCKQAGRSNTNHFLSQCTFLPDNDRRFMVKARQIVGILDDEQDTNYDLDPDPPCPETTLPTPDVVAYRVQTRQSPYMDVFHGHRVVRVTIDSGATGNMIRHSPAKHLGCPIISSAHSVQQVDGSSQLQVVGEIRTSFTRDNTDFTFEGLVVEDLDVEDPFYGGKRRCRAARQERGATWQWLYLHIRIPGPSQCPHNRSQSLCSPCPYSFQHCLAWRILGRTAPRRRSP